MFRFYSYVLNITSLNASLKWKVATDYFDAYNKAIYEIALIGKGNDERNNKICITLIILKDVIDNTMTYYEVSDNYNTNAANHLQARLSTNNADEIGLYNGQNRMNNETLTWLYR